jgi:small subunit ribosomal protein S16
MAVVIRLMRSGSKKRPFYRLVAADSRRQRDGRFLQILGHYNPISQPFELVVEKDLVQKWLDKGATPSEQVASLLRATGMKLGKASKPTKKAAPAGEATKARTRRKPRPVSARKTMVRAAKETAKKAGKPLPRKGAKRKAGEKK